jgi:hypothetical protein
MRAALFSYMRERDVLYCRVGGRQAILAAIRPSWRILYPNSGGLEDRRAADGCDVFR